MTKIKVEFKSVENRVMLEDGEELNEAIKHLHINTYNKTVYFIKPTWIAITLQYLM